MREQMNRSCRRLALLAILLLLPVLAYPRILMTPYLQAVTKTSVYVLAECDSKEAVRVEYGTTGDYGHSTTAGSIAQTGASPSTYVHKVLLSGLKPNTLYCYRAEQGGSTSAGASFRTAVEPGTSFRFAWLADVRGGTGIHDMIAARISDANPAVSLYGGDLCSSSSYRSFKDEFFRPRELELASHVPFFNATGNHERWSTNTKAFTQAPVSSSGKQEYYSFDYGDVHVLVLNNEITSTMGSPQYRFAERDLKESTNKWNIVISHKPAYCEGGHGNDVEMEAMSENLFEKYHVDIVLSGHSHFFQHSLVNKIHHFVIGTAGAPIYTPENGPNVLKYAADYCYAIGDVTPTTLHLVVYNDHGKVLDTLDLEKK